MWEIIYTLGYCGTPSLKDQPRAKHSRTTFMLISLKAIPLTDFTWKLHTLSKSVGIKMNLMNSFKN